MTFRLPRSQFLALTLFASTLGASLTSPTLAEESTTMNAEQTAVLNVIETMTSSFAQADIDGVMNTYEPNAMVMFEPGLGLSDEDAIRQGFTEFASMNPSFTYGEHQVIVAGDIGVHISPWQMKGTTPDGAAMEIGGLSVAVLRKQPDGKWLMVIDNPYGGQHITN